MPAKKDHNPAPHPKTLLNFFGTKPASKTDNKRNTPTNAKAGSSTKATKRSHTEVIVIDSDSDDEVEFVKITTSSKRQKLSPRNTGTSRIESTHSRFKLDVPNASGEDSVKENAIPTTGDTKQPGTSVFGVPFLLTAPNNRKTDATGWRAQSFGQPSGPLAQPTIVPAAVNATATGVAQVPIASSSKNPSRAIPDVDPTTDEWQKGGDEKSAQARLDTDAAQLFGEPSGPLARRKLVASVVQATITPLDEAPIPSSSRISDCSMRDIDISLDTWENGDDEKGLQGSLDSREEKDTDIIISDMKDDIVRKGRSSNLNDELDTYDDVIVTDEEDFGEEEEASKNMQPASGNAFSVMMSSLKENEIWKEASLAERKVPPGQKFKNSDKNGRRKAPFYKVLTGMPIAVDAFRYGAISNVTAYFLTHAHSDHYTNLSSTWKHGPIYCSQGTANLIIHMLSVDPKWVHPLPMDTPTLVPNTNGVMVTLIEANHCPGSCLFFFEGHQTVNSGDSNFKSQHVGSSKTFRYLHCGDFRASPQHVLHPAVRNKVIDLVYLDTTYLDPKYTFPPQPLVISACAEVAKRALSGESSKDNSAMFTWMKTTPAKGKTKESSRTLVVVGTYSIGKERIVKAIANALNSKVYCDARKAAILRCQGDQELDALLTSNPLEATVHLVPLATIDSDHMKTYLQRFKGAFASVIGFRPTGWTFTQAAGTDLLPSVPNILAKATSLQNFNHTDLKPSQKSTSTLKIYPVPYSEHSSFYELTCFAMSFDWMKMIATVNVGSEKSRGKMAKWVAKWDAERKRRGKTTIVPHRHPDYW